MKIDHLKITLAFLFLPLAFSAQDQKPLSYYFDDDGLSISNVILELDIAGLGIGQPSINLERKWSTILSTEIGFGRLLPNPGIEYFPNDLPPSELNTVIPAQFLFVNAKFFLNDRCPMGTYVGPQYAYKTYEYEDYINDADGSLKRNEFALLVGHQRIIWNRLVGDINAGIGVGADVYYYSYLEVRKMTLVVPINFKLGYAIF